MARPAAVHRGAALGHGRKFGSGEFSSVRLAGEHLPAIVYRPPPLILPHRLAWLQWAFAIAFMLTAVLLLLVSPDGLIRGATLLAFFLFLALFLPFSVFMQRHGADRAAISAQGVHVGHDSLLFIPWQSIEFVDAAGGWLWRGPRIRVTEVDAITSTPGWLRHLYRWPASPKSVKLAVPPSNARLGREFAAVLNYYLAHAAERTDIGLRPPAELPEPEPRALSLWRKVVVRLIIAAGLLLVFAYWGFFLLMLIERLSGG
jgi:hypothetical protein